MHLTRLQDFFTLGGGGHERRNQVYFVDSDKLPEEALKRKHRLEQDPTFRTNHMEYMEGMEVIQSDIKDKVEEAMKAFGYDAYTASDVEGAVP